MSSASSPTIAAPLDALPTTTPLDTLPSPEIAKEDPDEESLGNASNHEIDSSDDEGDDIKVNEEDVKFIAEESDQDDEEDIRTKKKRKRKIAIEDDLDDEDLELLNENYGIQSTKKWKKLRRKGDDDLQEDSEPSAPVKELVSLFDDDDAVAPEVIPKSRFEVDVSFPSNNVKDDLDDLDDFIIDDEDSDNDNKQELRALQKARKENKRKLVKNLGIRSGITDDTWREIDELFGDGSDYAWALVDDISQIKIHSDDESAGISDKKHDLKLSDLYEPSEIEAKMMTNEDDIIRVKDAPERYQLLGELPQYSEAEAHAESKFITDILLREQNPDNLSYQALFTAVAKAIKFILKDNFEVPFISTHRKDHFANILDQTTLWRVFDIRRQWDIIQARRLQVARSIDDLASGTLEDFILDVEEVGRFRELLASAQSLVEVTDVFEALQSNQGDAVKKLEFLRITTSQTKIYKRPTRRNLFEDAKTHGLGALSDKFGINVVKFVEAFVANLPDTYNPETDAEMPADAASKYFSGSFPNIETCLEGMFIIHSEGARHIIAQEITANPKLRQFVRKIYNSDAVITVTPTAKGKLEMGPGHKYYEKKASDFRNTPDGQFLQIIKAEEEGLINLSAKIENSDLFHTDLKQAISSDSYSAISQEWNKERFKIIELVMGQSLFPYIFKGLKEALSSEAIDNVLASCSRQLTDNIDMAPFDAMNRGRTDTPVMALSWGDGSATSPAIGVLLDFNGCLVDQIIFDRIHDYNSGGKQADLNRFKAFVEKHSVELVVISGSTPSTKTRLFEDIFRTIEDLMKENANVQIQTQMIDDSVARLYMDSKRAIREFPSQDSHTLLIRYCVSLARRALDPTMEYAGLYNSENEYEHLLLNPLQSLVPPEKFRQMFERTFCNVVNSCGVDVNLAASFEHKSHTLQFVCGLGPRKAQSMLSVISRLGRLESRSGLVKNRICASTIFMNCSSFIRIRKMHFQRRHGDDQMLDVLDDTRIHPEDYDLARKMAADAIEGDEQLDEDESPSMHVQELMEGDVSRLDQLLLEDYASELERRLGEPKRIVLYEIKDELKHPYRERRRRYFAPSDDQIFTMLTGLTDESLYLNMSITCTVTKVLERLVIVSFMNMDGTIHVRNLAENGTLGQTPEDHGIRVGSILKCKVTEIKKDRLSVELTARSSEVSNYVEIIKRDPYFSMAWEEKDAVAKIEENRNNVLRKTTTVSHPKFMNVNCPQAEQELESKDSGYYLLRPSSKHRRLAVSWKVAPDLYHHVDMGKSGKMRYATGQETFTDMDELLTTYIEPLIRNVQELRGFPKFKDKDRAAMESFITQEMLASKRFVYGFAPVPDYATQFYLMYQHVNGSRPKYHSVSVTHAGFKFEKKVYSRLEPMVGAFKSMEGKIANERARLRKQQQAQGGAPSRSGVRPPSQAVPPRR